MKVTRQVVLLSSPEIWRQGHGPQHPLKPERLQRTFELISEYGILAAQNIQVLPPRLAAEKELLLFHTADYLTAVRDLSAGKMGHSHYKYNFGPGDNPVFYGMFESEGRKVGSAVMGAELILQGSCDTVFSYSGGLHHGKPDAASGFCVFNDAAVAIMWLLDKGQRVAYVDIDVHHGDGVQDAFYSTDQVLTISLHQDGRTLFPGTGDVEEIGIGIGKGYSVNIPLPPYTDDAQYLWAFNQVVPPLLERFQPDVTVTQLGVDTHFSDPLANLSLTTHAQAELVTILQSLSPKWLAIGGGGYNLSTVPRSWTIAFGIMCGLSLPNELPQKYRARYGGEWLHDRNIPAIDPQTKVRNQQQIINVVDQLKKDFGLE